jgi:hypothetical protein
MTHGKPAPSRPGIRELTQEEIGAVAGAGDFLLVTPPDPIIGSILVSSPGDPILPLLKIPPNPIVQFIPHEIPT